jgi:Zn-finger nucleic acid-binding protein
MEAVRYGAGDRVVHRCTACHGLWFKPVDLTRLRNTYKAEIIDAGSTRKGKELNKVEDIDCPECGKQMSKVSDDDQTHIWYESCPDGHGVYFDAGELTDLSQDTFMDTIKGWITGSRN